MKLSQAAEEYLEKLIASLMICNKTLDVSPKDACFLHFERLYWKVPAGTRIKTSNREEKSTIIALAGVIFCFLIAGFYSLAHISFELIMQPSLSGHVVILLPSLLTTGIVWVSYHVKCQMMLLCPMLKVLVYKKAIPMKQ